MEKVAIFTSKGQRDGAERAKVVQDDAILQLAHSHWPIADCTTVV